jgi:ubiquinol-cytochrome c reductase cytochrome b subunit
MAVFTTAPHYRARKLYAQYCAGCHNGAERKGPELGPGYNSRAWIRAFLLDPSGPRFFGPTKIDDMKPVELRGVDLDAVVELVYEQTGAPDADKALASAGRRLFDEGDCSNCHSIGGTGEEDIGPDLGGRGTVDMLADFLANPAHPRYFGEANEMPKFANKLGPDDRRQMAELLVWWRSASAAEEER